MTRAEWDALIQRVEQAEADHQAPWIKRAVDAAWNACWITDAVWHRAEELLRAGAYLDAAVSLVPSGWTAWGLRSRGGLTSFNAEISRIHGPEDEEQAIFGRGPTPALAIVAAALRARRAMEDNRDE